MDDTTAGNIKVEVNKRGWGAHDRSRKAVLSRRYPTIEDLRARARRRIPKFAFDFVDGGQGSESGVARNAAALAAIDLVPRYCIDVANTTTEIELFGRRYAAPIGIAPMGMGGLAWPGAEEYYAPAAQQARIPFVLASVGSAAIERVAALAPDVFWFQLYRIPRNNFAIGYDLIRRANTAGAHALVLTVDSVTRTKRPRDLRNELVIPFRLTLRKYYDMLTSPAWLCTLAKHGTPRFENFAPYVGGRNVAALSGFASTEINGGHTFEEIARMRDLWPRALLVKGVLHPQDAEKLVALGVDGVMVSNHGGRVLEATPPAIDVLPAVAAAVGNRATVIFDSGIRSGVDVVRALALGAKATFAGRPYVYGLAALGPDGPRHVIDMFMDETKAALGQLGACSVAEAASIMVRHPNAIKF